MAAKSLTDFHPILILTTAGSLSEAKKISRLILSHRLAACVNILSGVDSHYWWRGAMRRATEFLLLIKSSRSRLNDLAKLVKKYHSYEVPELIAFSVVWGDRRYLHWLKESMEKP